MAVGGRVPLEYTPRSQPTSTGSTMFGSLIHDAAAHLQCWKLLPSCPAHLGIHQKSGTEQEPPWTHLSAISAFLGTAKDLHSCKRPHRHPGESQQPQLRYPDTSSIPRKERHSPQASLQAKVSEDIARPRRKFLLKKRMDIDALLRAQITTS